jgi:hypothetical protein
VHVEVGKGQADEGQEAHDDGKTRHCVTLKLC